MTRVPGVGAAGRVQVLQMRGQQEALVKDRRFRRVPMWTPPHNRFEQAALGVELLKLRPQPQLIHSPDFIPPKYRRFRAVANVHDLAFLKLPEITLLTDESKRYYGQVQNAARDVDALIALSTSARDDIVNLLGVSPDKVAIIPGAAGEEFKPPADVAEAQRSAARMFDLPPPERGGYVLFVSTIEPRKNLTTLLEAYSLLQRRGRCVTPLPALAVAGREGWLYEQVYKRMGELRITDQVRFLGEVPGAKLVSLYQGARAFVMPSLYEGFGLPALEALACGTPVLTSDRGSLPEVVGTAGVLLNANDPEAWAAALERVLTDGEEEARLREAGPQQAAGFSWERAAAETWELYRRVLRSEL
jgi:glycosyltransferase involved in cell wall biosynthesis